MPCDDDIKSWLDAKRWKRRDAKIERARKLPGLPAA
jgi:hypothetical protein